MTAVAFIIADVIRKRNGVIVLLAAFGVTGCTAPTRPQRCACPTRAAGPVQEATTASPLPEAPSPDDGPPAEAAAHPTTDEVARRREPQYRIEHALALDPRRLILTREEIRLSLFERSLIQLVEDDRVKWTRKAGYLMRPIYPTVADDLVLIHSVEPGDRSEDIVAALDLESGRERWRRVGEIVRIGPVHGRHGVIEQGDERMAVMDFAKNRVIATVQGPWEDAWIGSRYAVLFNHNLFRAGAQVVGARVVDLKSGKVVAIDDFDPMCSSGDLVVGLDGTADTVAFDASTGQMRWKVERDPRPYSVLGFQDCARYRGSLVVTSTNNLVGLDPATGKHRWAIEFSPFADLEFGDWPEDLPRYVTGRGDRLNLLVVVDLERQKIVARIQVPSVRDGEGADLYNNGDWIGHLPHAALAVRPWDCRSPWAVTMLDPQSGHFSRWAWPDREVPSVPFARPIASIETTVFVAPRHGMPLENPGTGRFTVSVAAAATPKELREVLTPPRPRLDGHSPVSRNDYAGLAAACRLPPTTE